MTRPGACRGSAESASCVYDRHYRQSYRFNLKQVTVYVTRRTAATRELEKQNILTSTIGPPYMTGTRCARSLQKVQIGWDRVMKAGDQIQEEIRQNARIKNTKE